LSAARRAWSKCINGMILSGCCRLLDATGIEPSDYTTGAIQRPTAILRPRAPPQKPSLKSQSQSTPPIPVYSKLRIDATIPPCDAYYVGLLPPEIAQASTDTRQAPLRIGTRRGSHWDASAESRPHRGRISRDRTAACLRGEVLKRVSRSDPEPEVGSLDLHLPHGGQRGGGDHKSTPIHGRTR
jgi:hypothetical protein